MLYFFEEYCYSQRCNSHWDVDIFALRHGASKKDALMVENVSSFNHDLPEKGERILFFCQEDDGSYRLYLMMVLAVDEECYPFVKWKHEIIMKDDCCPFGLYTDNLQCAVSLSIQAWTPDRRSS